MRNKFITLIFALIVLISCCGFNAFAWNSDFEELSVDIQYDTEGASFTVEGITPATYGQRIMIVAYRPAMTGGLTAELRNAKNPSSIEPMTTPAETKVFRLDEIVADNNGRFSGEWELNAGIENGEYMIIKVSGTGKTPVQASKLFYFESSEHFQNVTLRAFEDLTGDALGELLVEKKLLLGITKDDSYYRDNEVETMFAAIRDNDYVADSETGNLFNEKKDVITVLNRVEALQNLPDVPTSTDVAYLIRDYGYLMEYDFTSANKDYTLMKSESQGIAAGVFADKAPICLSDIERVIEQAVGIAMMNSKDSTTIGPVVDKYAAVLGIDATDYETYCNTYTAYEVNKAFVGRNFKKPSEVTKALSDRIVVLSNGGDSTSDSTDNGNDYGDGGGGSSRPVSGTTTDMGTVVKPVPETENKSNYNDLSKEHWAAEAVKALSSKNVINGFSDGTFRPDDSVTREQMVKMLVEAFNLVGKSDASFADVASERWSAKYIDMAVACGIVKGTDEGRFSPEADVTRQDAAVMLARLCDAKAISLSGTVVLTDDKIIADYAKESVSRLAGAGVISGFEDGSFRPNEALTRAQAAKLIYSLLNRYGG